MENIQGFFHGFRSLTTKTAVNITWNYFRMCAVFFYATQQYLGRYTMAAGLRTKFSVSIKG